MQIFLPETDRSALNLSISPCSLSMAQTSSSYEPYARYNPNKQLDKPDPAVETAIQ